jgi:hypothetical protein
VMPSVSIMYAQQIVAEREMPWTQCTYSLPP